LATQLRDKLGDQADSVIREVNLYLEDKPIEIPMPLEATTYADITLSFDGKKDMRPSSKLRFDIIDQMLRTGIIHFALEMKRAQIVRVFSEGRFRIESPDDELKEIAEASLKFILPKMANDFTWSALAYGTSFQEEVWEWKTKYELGLSKSRGSSNRFLVPKVPRSVKVETVNHIIRDVDENFNGFAQRKRATTGSLPGGATAVSLDDANLIPVDRQAALVIPLNERFGNLWGESFLKPMYVTWLWYEVILRTMHRYMERMAIPVALGRAPSRGRVGVEGEADPVRALDLILSVAGNAAKSNAVAIPSDRDENNNYLWDLGYLTADERSQPFVTVLEFLGQEIIRGSLSADRALSQSSGGVGSFNIGEVHARASALSSEMMVLQFLYYLNRFFIPGFSLYNKGRNGPPIWMVTQAIDMQERDLLMKLLNIAGNSDAGARLFEMLDWRSMTDTSNVPTLSEEEVEQVKKEREKESLDKQKRQQQMMQKFNVDGQVQPKKNEPPGAKLPRPGGDVVKQEEKLDRVLQLLEDGVVPIFLQGDGFDEAKIVRDATGKFARKAGSKKGLDADQKKDLVN
jgi:hypothetical protein